MFLIASLTLFLLSRKGSYSWKAVSLSWFQFCLLELPMLESKMLVECMPVLHPSRDNFFYISCDFFSSITKQNSNQVSCLGLHVFQRLRTGSMRNHIFSVVAHRCNMPFPPGNLQDECIEGWDIANTTFNPNTSFALCKSRCTQNNASEFLCFSSLESSTLVSLVRGNQWSLRALVWQLTLPHGTSPKDLVLYKVTLSSLDPLSP